MILEFKIGDHIKKVFGNLYMSEKIFKIIDLKEVKGGNWHDGFSVNIVVTIEPIIPDDVLAVAVNPETDTEEYRIQHINVMCQINNVFAIRVD